MTKVKTDKKENTQRGGSGRDTEAKAAGEFLASAEAVCGEGDTQVARRGEKNIWLWRRSCERGFLSEKLIFGQLQSWLSYILYHGQPESDQGGSTRVGSTC